MRTHLLQVAGRLLIPFIFVGCQEASTDPQGTGTTDQTSDRSTINAATTSKAGRTTVFHFVANGEFARVFWGDADQGNFGGLEVTQGGTPSAPEVFVQYAIGICEPDGFCPGTLSGGAGRIPPGDLTGNGSHLHLRTDTNNDPDFIVFAGSGGLIDVEWVRVPGVEERISGSVYTRFPGVNSFRSHGTTTRRFATATGSVVGAGIALNGEPGSEGFIGNEHSVTVTHEFNR